MSTVHPDLRVLLLPNREGSLLLPVAAVVEILRPEGTLPPSPGAPGWLIGSLEWRGRQLPLVRVVERAGPVRPYAVVCCAPGGGTELPFLALESAGLPRLERVKLADLGPGLGAGAPPPLFTARAFSLSGKPTWLLDLGALEQALAA